MADIYGRQLGEYWCEGEWDEVWPYVGKTPSPYVPKYPQKPWEGAKNETARMDALYKRIVQLETENKKITDPRDNGPKA